jgi:4-amino-4-deoxy-L-arabinose transferase-like glycosyltransferase
MTESDPKDEAAAPETKESAPADDAAKAEAPSDDAPSEEAPAREATGDEPDEEGDDDESDDDEPAPPPKAKEPPAEKPLAAAKAKAKSKPKPDAKADAPEEPKKKEEDKLLPRGNPFRWARGGVILLVSGFLAFLLCAHDGQLRWGVPLGLLCVLAASLGVLDLVGSFDDPPSAESIVAHRTDIGRMARPTALLVATSAIFLAALMGAQNGGTLPQLGWGVFVTASFLALVFAVFDFGRALGPWAEDEAGVARPIWRRHGFWLVALGALLYFPMLGSYSLWDPWETHYGEVAREILARDDWVSLWWAQDGWFWSKPILNFWIQSLAMASAGTHYQPDQMLIGAGGAAVAHPEWVVRAPNVLLTIMGMYLLYKGVSKVFGRRAGLLGGIVLATMPDWYFLAHQTMTDMPLVATLTSAMGLLLLGLHTDAEKRVRLYQLDAGKTVLRVSGWHLVMLAVLVCALPQILYLLSRNIELVLHGDGPHGFRTHWDIFTSGSGPTVGAGNCGLPGNEACTPTHPASIPKAAGVNPQTFGLEMLRFFGGFEPAFQAILWCIGLSLILYLNWGERRLRRIYYLGAWFFAAIATMGKGPLGFVLPMVCGFAYVASKKRWSELLRFELLSGLLLILVVGLPWYVAMYVRHGSPFTDRLIFHDMFNRALHHVHDTNEGDDTSFRFYIWQLGYAFFPWTALAPLGLVWWLRRPDDADRGKGDVSVFLVMWFVFAFFLFSFMGTKFHHYIFPAVPPAAMLIGIVLDAMMERTGPTELERERARVAAPNFEENLRKQEVKNHEGLMLGGAALAGALLVALVGRDLVIKPENADQPGAIRFLQLFTYNYRRPWPDDLDFSKTLLFFSIAAGVLCLVLVSRQLRRYGVMVFAGFAIICALWGLDVYMIKTAPHWGQHEVIQAYYDTRKSPDEPIVAYQMNWKGENFYTGNRIPAFVSTGGPFSTWIKQQRDKGVKVIFFVTEHGRTGGLRSEVGAKSYTEVTDKKVCNKFVLVRAEF